MNNTMRIHLQCCVMDKISRAIKKLECLRTIQRYTRIQL